MKKSTSSALPSHSELLKGHLLGIIITSASNAKKRIESDGTLIKDHLILERSPEEIKEEIALKNGIRSMAAALTIFKKIRIDQENKYPESINQLIDNITAIINRPLGENSAINLITLANPETYKLFEKESKEKQAQITKELTDVIDETVQLVVKLQNEIPRLADEQKQNSENNMLRDVLNNILEGLNSLLNLIIKAATRIANGEPLYQKYGPPIKKDYQEQRTSDLESIQRREEINTPFLTM